MPRKEIQNLKKELTLEQLEQGCEKALENADNLLKDAKILLRNKRWARAYFLGSMAIEEIGKYVMIKSAQVRIIYGNQDWKSFWKRFKSHKSKRGLFLHLEYLFSETPPSNYLKKLPKEEDAEEFLKMASLYTDYYEDGFYNPMDVIDEKIATNAVKLAEKRLNNIKWLAEKLKGSLSRLDKKKIEEFFGKIGLKELIDNLKKTKR